MHLCVRLVSFLVIFLFAMISHSETRTSLNIQGLSFISPDFDDPQKSNFGFVGATLKSYEKSPQLFVIDFRGAYALGNSSLSYLNFKEAYFSFQIDNDGKKSKLFLGRKLKSWSSLDEQWNLGFFQPQFRWNPLNPENQGLTGLFWDQENELVSYSLFFSALFIPDQGASYEVKDGKFEDSSPWFRAPPQQIKFQGQILPIDYNMNKPEVSKVIFQTLSALQVRIGRSAGYFANFSSAFKPAHHFAVGYSGVLVTNRVKIDVTPMVFMENVNALDLGYRDLWGLAQFSVLHKNPINPVFETSQNTPQIDQSLSWGPKLRYNLNPFQLELAYFDTQGGDVIESGPDTSPDRASLTQRFRFRQAAQFQVTYSSVFMKMLKLDSTFQYRQSQRDQFQQISFINKLNLKGPWSFWSDLVLIETGDEGNLNMNAYRNLDQIWIGASYDL